MPQIRLTEKSIDKLKAPDPSGRQVLHWDRRAEAASLFYVPASQIPRRTSPSATCPAGKRAA